VPPGVDHAFFSPGNRGGARAALGLGASEHPVLLFVGRIQPLKGLAVAVRALAALDEQRAMLLVVGGPSGPDGAAELERVRDLVAELGLASRVRFVDPQPHHLLADYYRAADVCLVPSRTESFGLVALEAAACGTPVVAASVGGLRSIVADGETGLLVDGRDPLQWATTVALLLRDHDLASAMGPRPGRWYRRAAGGGRDATTTYSELRPRSLRYEVYFLPGPPKNHLELYRWLLRRNHHEPYNARFSIGPDGDVYLTGRVLYQHLD